MKYSIQTFAIFAVMFFTVELFGLFVIKSYITVPLPFGIQPPDIEKSQSPAYFLVSLVIITLIMLSLFKLRMRLMAQLLFGSAFVTAATISLSVFIDGTVAFVLAALVTIIVIKDRDIFMHNFLQIMTYGGASAVFMPILNLFSVSVLFIALSLYDIIAVFGTKHMIALARQGADLGIFPGIFIINKGESAVLGGGDLAMPMLLAGVLLRDFGMLQAFGAVFGAFLGLIALILIGEKKKFYPALPFVGAGSLLGLLLSFAL